MDADSRARAAFGDRLRMRREALGLTQREFAELVGYKTDKTVSEWELGKRWPKEHQRPLIARAAQCDEAWLFYGAAQKGAVVERTAVAVDGFVASKDPVARLVDADLAERLRHMDLGDLPATPAMIRAIVLEALATASGR